MSFDHASRAGPILIAFTLALLLAAVPVATAAEHGGSGGNETDTGSVPPSGCPDDLSSARSTDAFQRAGASSPDAATQTTVSCSGGIVLTATTADPLGAGESYVVFFTLHDADTGELLDAPFVQVNLTGASAKGDAVVPEVAASVHGTDGLKAVAIHPPSTGQATLTIELPRKLTVHEISFDVAEAGIGTNEEGPGGIVPGFEAFVVVAGLVAVAVVLRRRPPKAMAVLMAVAMLSGPALAHAGAPHSADNDSIDIQFTPNPSGLSIATDGLSITAEAGVDQPETSFDLGDLSTAAGPSADHAYAEPGAYLVQLVAYDPSTLTGAVYDDLVTVGEGESNQAPSPVVTASTRWATHGDEVTLSAGDSVAAGDDDNHLFIWAIGRSPVGEDDYVYTVEAVTDGPEWSWTAPTADADHRFEVFAVDGRRGIANASTQVRVTESLPPESEEYDPFVGDLLYPEDENNPDQLETVGDSSRTHTFTTAYPATVTAELDYTTLDDQDPQQGFPDVDMRIDQEAATGTSVPDTLELDVGAGEHTLQVWLADGFDANYTVSVRADYRLNPFS